MDIVTSIILQTVFIALALVALVLRCWVRFGIERRTLTVADYLTWAGWLFTVAWFICCTLSQNIQRTHPLVGEELLTDSVEYLKVVFIGSYFFDIGLYLPKASIVAFYWWLIPQGFRRLRIALYLSAGYLFCAFLATLMLDTLWARPISHNWSIEHQLESLWNGYPPFIANWALNITTDALLFCLPFFIITCLKLRRRQRIGLVAIFSLGAITMIISISRFIAYAVTDYGIVDTDGNAWCTAELCTALVVVSLPGLKSLIVRPGQGSSANTSAGNLSYGRKSKSRPAGLQPGFGSQPAGSIQAHGTHSHVQAGKWDDEVELMSMDRKGSVTPTRSLSTALGGELREVEALDSSSGVMVTTDVTVTRDVV